MKKEVYLIEGMHCAACSSAVERVTRKLSGVVRSDVNLTTNKMDIEYDESLVRRQIMVKIRSRASSRAFQKEDQTKEKP
jgi:Cu+-exporting ATPase